MALVQAKTFRVNDFLSLRLENGNSNIYVKGRLFNQCKYLLLNIPVDRIEDYDEVGSIDEAEITLNRSMERDHSKVPPETEFWGHCSNLQAWADNGYDTRLLHRNLAFPLLRALSEQGDSQAKKVFKEEIALRFSSGHAPVMEYLLNGHYLSHLNAEELESLVEATTFTQFLIKKQIQNLIIEKIITNADSNKDKLKHYLLQPGPTAEYMVYSIKRRSPVVLSRILMELIEKYEKGLLDADVGKTVENNLFPLFIPHLQQEHISRLLENPHSILQKKYLKAGSSCFPLKENGTLDLVEANAVSLKLLEKIEHPEKLKRLIINNGNLINTLTVGKFTELEELSLQNNHITTIKGLNSLTKLKKLQLQDNDISDISVLGKLSKLRYLDLENNNISQFQGLEQLNSLQYLNLACNKISRLANISCLKTLKTLQLSNNNIGLLDCTKLPPVNHIDLTQNPIVAIKNHRNHFSIECPITFIISLLLSDEKIFIRVKDKSVILLECDKVLTNHEGFWYQPLETRDKYPGLATIHTLSSDTTHPTIEIDELYLSKFNDFYSEENSLELKLKDLYSTLQAWVEKNYNTQILGKQIALPLLKELKKSNSLKANISQVRPELSYL